MYLRSCGPLSSPFSFCALCTCAIAQNSFGVGPGAPCNFDIVDGRGFLIACYVIYAPCAQPIIRGWDSAGWHPHLWHCVTSSQPFAHAPSIPPHAYPLPSQGLCSPRRVPQPQEPATFVCGWCCVVPLAFATGVCRAFCSPSDSHNAFCRARDSPNTAEPGNCVAAHLARLAEPTAPSRRQAPQLHPAGCPVRTLGSAKQCLHAKQQVA